MDFNAPLNALRAFEAAARLGSFTAAAVELGVSSAAVSQQVKALEEYWQQALFIRQGNRLSLTDAGQTAYPKLAQSMNSVAVLSAQMKSNESGKTRLVLSAPHSVVETWLPEKLSAMGGTTGHEPVDIRIDDDPVDFARDKIDLRIFFGHDLYGDYQIQTLFTDSLIAVAGPDIVRQFGRIVADVPDRYLIHTHWGSGFTSSPNWESVLPVERTFKRDLGLRVHTSSTALNFARNGYGAALVPFAMAAADISSGRVLQMEAPPVKLPRSYRVAYPKRLQSHAPVVRLLSALSDWPGQDA